jgi:putative RNA 2'-phosphotransferase
MQEKIRTRTSKFLSLILRHHPETVGIALDEHGWADVSELTEKMKLAKEDLDEIVRLDEKGRYQYDEGGTRIRAVQGHSIAVDAEAERKIPPQALYHGTAAKSAASILKQGLLPMERLYVHLSQDPETARKVGLRHGRPVVFLVLAEAMAENGFVFYRAANGVWLTERVPKEYLVRL